MSEHTYLDFANQNVVPTNLLFLNQAQLTKLLKVMIRNTWTAETQGPLNFSDTGRFSVLEEVPVDFPCFASKSIFQLGFGFCLQRSMP